MRFLLGLCFFLIIVGLIVIGELRWDVELLKEGVKELEEKDKDRDYKRNWISRKEK